MESGSASGVCADSRIMNIIPADSVSADMKIGMWHLERKVDQ